MSKEIIPCDVGTTEHLIANEQVAEQVVHRFVTEIRSSPTIVS